MNTPSQTTRRTVPPGYSEAFHRAQLLGEEALQLLFDSIAKSQAGQVSLRLAASVEGNTAATVFSAPNGLRLVFGSNVPPRRRRELDEAGYRLLT